MKAQTDLITTDSGDVLNVSKASRNILLNFSIKRACYVPQPSVVTLGQYISLKSPKSVMALYHIVFFFNNLEQLVHHFLINRLPIRKTFTTIAMLNIHKITCIILGFLIWNNLCTIS
jgi:hypothetical protein